MTLSLVFSERGEPKWRDCTQSAAIMVCKHGGIDMPYTSAFRELFEDSEGLPEPDADGIEEPLTEQEAGLIGFWRCDIAARKLWGVAPHDAGESELPGLLRETRIAVALTGSGPGLPSGFAGNHAVTFKARADGQLDVFDPLAAMGALPTWASLSTILNWHARLPTDIRWTREDEFKTAIKPTLDIHPFAKPRRWSIRPGTILRAYDPNRPGQTLGPPGRWSKRSAAMADAEVWVIWPNAATAKIPMGGPFLRVSSTTGPYAGLLVVESKVDLEK
jgi:hypothetical protein